MKTLTILTYTYGASKSPVIILNYHNGKEPLEFYPKENLVDVELLYAIGEAIKNDYEIQYNDNPTVSDLKFHLKEM